MPALPALFATTVIGWFTVGHAIQAGIVIYGAWRAAQMRKDLRRAYSSGLADHKVMLRSSDAPRGVLYGRQRISGPLLYARGAVSDADPYVWLVIGLPAQHKLHAIDDVWLDDRSLGPLDAAGNVIAGPFALVHTQTHTVTGQVPANNQIALTPRAGVTEPITVTRIVSSVATPISSGFSGEDSQIVDALPVGVVPGTQGTSSPVVSVAPPGAAGKQYTITFEYQFTRSHLRVWKHLGLEQGEPPPAELVATSDYKASAIGRRTPRLIIRVLPDRQVFPTGIGSFSAIVRGKDDIYDWRTGQRGYTTNAFLCTADYAIEKCGVPFEDINTTLATSHATICDETVPTRPLNSPFRIESIQATNPAVVRCLSHGLVTGDVAKIEEAQGMTAINGIDYPVRMIDLNTFELVGCDATSLPAYTGSGYPVRVGQARYTADCFLPSTTLPIQNVPETIGAMDGSLVYSGATCDIRAGAFEEPEVVLTADDIVGDWTCEPRPQRPEIFNAVRGRFVDPRNFWTTNEFPPYRSATYQAQDGGRLIEREIDPPAQIDSERAQRLTKQILRRARAGLTFSAPFNLGAFGLSPEQTVRLTIPALGFDEKVARIGSYQDAGKGVVNLTFREDAAALYDWNFDEARDPDPAPNTTLPDVRVVQPIVNLRVQSGLAQTVFTSTGPLRSSARVTWAPLTDMLVLHSGRIVLQWKLAQQDAWTTVPLSPREETYLLPVQRGDQLVVQVWAENSLGVRGPVATETHTAVDAPTDFVVGNRLRNAALIWSDAGGVFSFAGWGVTPDPGATGVGGLQPMIPWDDPDDIFTNQTGYVKWVHAAGSGANGSTCRSSAITVTEAEHRLLYFVDAAVFNGTLLTEYWFYNKSDEVVSLALGTPSAKRILTQTPGISDLGRVQYFGSQFEPASAASLAMAYIRFSLRLIRTDPALPAIAFFGRPYVGPSRAGQVRFPPWSP